MSQLAAFTPGPEIRKPKPSKDTGTVDLAQPLMDAANSEWIGAWAFRQWDQDRIPSDGTFSPFDDKVWPTLSEGIEPDYFEMFSDAFSMDRALKVREQALSVQNSRRRLGEMGWQGTALTIGANIFDPVNLATMLIPGAGEAVGATKAARLLQMAKAGLVVGGPNAVLEAYRASRDPLSGPVDVAKAGLSGFGFGAMTHAAAGAGRLRTAAAGAIGQAAPSTAIDLIRGASEGEFDGTSALYGAGFNLLLGGGLGAMHGGRIMRAIEAADAADTGAPLTPIGKRVTTVPEAETVRAARSEVEALTAFADERPTLTGVARFFGMEADEIAASSFFRQPGDKLHQKLPEGFRLVNEPELGARLASDGSIEVGGIFRGSSAQDRRAMVEFEIIKPEAARAIAADIKARAGTGERPASWEAIIESRFGIGPDDAKVVADHLREAIGETTPGAAQTTPSPAEGKDLGGSIGAASQAQMAAQKNIRPDRPPDAPDAAAATDAPASFSAARWDLAGHAFGKAWLPKPLRWFGNMLLEDALSKKGNIAQGDTLEAWRRRKINTHETEAAIAFDTNFRGWFEQNRAKYGMLGGKQAQDDFARLVSDAIDGSSSINDPAVAAAAAKFREQIEQVFDIAGYMGVEGYERVFSSSDYLPRIVSLPRLMEVRAKWGQARLEQMIAQGFEDVTAVIRSGQVAIDPKLAERLAKAYLHNVENAKIGLDGDRATYLDTRDLKNRGFTPEEIAFIESKLGAEANDTANPTRLKHRLPIERASIQDPQLGTLNLSDIMERDVRALFRNYAQSLIGASVKSEFLRGAGMRSGRKIESFEDFRKWTFEEAEPWIKSGKTANDQQKRAAAIEERLQTAETVLNLLTNKQRMGGEGQINDILRGIRAYGFVRVMNMSGWAQIADLGSTIGEAGFSAMGKQMPAMGKLFDRAADGKLTDAGLRELEAINALGTDNIRHSAAGSFDDSGGIGEQATGIMHRMQRATGWISGLIPIDTALQRISGVVAEQAIYDVAKSGKPMNAARRAQLGLSDADWAAVSKAILDPQNGATLVNGRVAMLNIDKWTDRDAAAKFVVAMDRMTRRMVTRPDLGNMSLWMTKGWGQSLIQFRSFMNAAWTKHFLSGAQRLSMKDWSIFRNWAMQSFFASLGYAGMIYTRSLGRPDADEYRKKMLNPTQIAKAAFGRAGYSSIFPMAADSVAPMFGAKAPFAGFRTTGLANDPLFGNPTMDLLSQIGYAPGEGFLPLPMKLAMAAVKGPTQRDAQALLRILPFQNAMGLRNALEKIVGDQLPERR